MAGGREPPQCQRHEDLCRETQRSSQGLLGARLILQCMKRFMKKIICEELYSTFPAFSDHFLSWFLLADSACSPDVKIPREKNIWWICLFSWYSVPGAEPSLTVVPGTEEVGMASGPSSAPCSITPLPNKKIKIKKLWEWPQAQCWKEAKEKWRWLRENVEEVAQ